MGLLTPDQCLLKQELEHNKLKQQQQQKINYEPNNAIHAHQTTKKCTNVDVCVRFFKTAVQSPSLS